MFRKIAEKQQSIIDDFQNKIVASSKEAAGENSELAKQQKEAILNTTESFKDTPPEGREKMLDNLAKSYSGNEDELKAELKKKLGW